MEDLEDLYCENLAEDRQGFDTRSTGKFHGNYYNRAIFPILSLDNIVPPVLHIMLGIVLKLFNLLLSRCREIDQQQVDNPTHQAALETNETEWARKREELFELETRLQGLGCAHVDLYNCQERIEQVLVGNYAEIDKIVHDSDNGAKRATANFERCTGVKCFVSEWDENVSWFLCEECEMWKHGLCELLTQSRQERIGQDLEEFRCLTFHSDDLLTLVEEQKQELRKERETVGAAVLETKTACSKFQETANKSMGNLEVKLNDILRSIKVDRQAFHGDIFVGNHCKIILAKHEYVCSVLEGDEIYDKIVHLLRVFGGNPATSVHQKISF